MLLSMKRFFSTAILLPITSALILLALALSLSLPATAVASAAPIPGLTETPVYKDLNQFVTKLNAETGRTITISGRDIYQNNLESKVAATLLTNNSLHQRRAKNALSQRKLKLNSSLKQAQRFSARRQVQIKRDWRKALEKIQIKLEREVNRLEANYQSSFADIDRRVSAAQAELRKARTVAEQTQARNKIKQLRIENERLVRDQLADIRKLENRSSKTAERAEADYRNAKRDQSRKSERQLRRIRERSKADYRIRLDRLVEFRVAGTALVESRRVIGQAAIDSMVIV